MKPLILTITNKKYTYNHANNGMGVWKTISLDFDYKQ